MPPLQAFRDNHRIQFQDPQLADHLWTATGLRQLCSGLPGEDGRDAAVGLNPNIRIYRYQSGQKFGRHIDESNELGGKRYTQYTLLIYLSQCGGGQTVFYGESGRGAAGCCMQPVAGWLWQAGSGARPVQSRHLNRCYRAACALLPAATPRAGSRNRKLASVTPQPGLALLHKHGDYCLEHEALAVTSGVKYVLRSDVVFQRR